MQERRFEAIMPVCGFAPLKLCATRSASLWRPMESEVGLPARCVPVTTGGRRRDMNSIKGILIENYA